MAELRATPYANPLTGLSNDAIQGLLAFMQDKRRTQQLQGLGNLLESTGIPKTIERAAYAESPRGLLDALTNVNRANVPLLKPETAEALLTLSPVPSGANKAAMAAGRAGERVAERVVPQIMERGGLPAEILQGMAQNTRSNVFLETKPKTPNPLVGSRYETEYIGGLAPKTPTRIEDTKGSSFMILPWDSTTRNMKIKSVSDEVLPEAVITEGGQDFARFLENIEKGIGGASGESIAKKIMQRVKIAQEENLAAGGNGQVFMLPSTMSTYAENFSTMPTEVLLQLIKKADLPKSRIDTINQQIRNFKDVDGNQNFTGFKGIETIEGQKQLFTGEGVNDTAGELRKAFVNRMYLKDNQKAIGFNEEDLVNALTDDALRGLPRGYAGNTIIKANPEGLLTPSSHKSYSTNFAGTYGGSLEGGLLGNVPVEILLPKSYGKIEREFAGKRGDMRSNVIGALEKRKAGVSDVVDQEMIDNYYRYIAEKELGLLD
jgi:hypothetical protein